MNPGLAESTSLHHGKEIEQAIDLLKKGGLVAFPTDTVYGLGAHPFIASAVERVYQVKERPRQQALPLLLADPSEILGVAWGVPELAWRLVERFLPGALTIVLWKRPSVPAAVTAGGDRVAVRIPNHPLPLALLRGLGAPLVGTSANLTGRPSPLTAQEVREQIGDRIDLIIDGGRCPLGVESTVIDVTGETPRILRQGAIAREDIERVSGKCIVAGAG